MTKQVELTNSQQKKVDFILNLLLNCMGRYKDNYELKEKELSYLDDTQLVSLFAVLIHKDAKSSAFADRVHVFISKRGRVTYYDHRDAKVKTWTGSNIWTLICANE